MASTFTTMSIISLVLTFALLSQGASATSFKVVNNCGGTVNVRVAENPGPSIGTGGFSLGPGQSMGLNPPDGWAGNIGYAETPSLLAEFSINIQAGVDHFDLSAVDGFQLDRGMRISGADPSVGCSARRDICPGENVNGGACVNPARDDPNTNYANSVRANCPDAFSWSGDNSKDHGTGTGGGFTITFCG